jgi:hypothetical protein
MKEDNNAPGILRASSAELLAQILTKQGDIAKAQKNYDFVGAIARMGFNRTFR